MRPNDRRYRKSHEWAKDLGDGHCLVGLTDYAVQHLSDLVFLDVPEPGADVMADEPFGEIESVKAVSDLFAPVTGEIVEVNESVQGDLSILNSDPFEAGWIVKIRMESPEELNRLLDAAAYEEAIAKEAAENG